MKINIFGMDHSGNGIGKIDNKIVFVLKGVVGDECQIKIIKEHKNYSIGVIEEIIKPSNDRVKAICPYYDRCGGCNISSLSYAKQLDFKKEKVRNIFDKYLEMKIKPAIIESDEVYQYRNKITYHGNSDVLGLVDIDNNVMDVGSCLLVSDRVNELYKVIREMDIKKIDKVIIKECNNGLILSVYGELVIDKLMDKCLAIYLNDKCIYKREDGYITIGKLKYIVSNRSFFQVNTKNIVKLYEAIKKLGNFKKSDKVIDLYCGVGSISIYIAGEVEHVLGIEIIPEAIRDAYNNALLNGIDNAEFKCGDVSKLIDSNISCDKLIVDPPRVGLDKHTNMIINNSMIEEIIYVSCDAMTLARDIKMLSNYRVKDILLVDMFPQTHHVECVSVLKLKESTEM